MKYNAKQLVRDIKRLDIKCRVKFIFLFGSYAANEAKSYSDIDLSIYYQGNAKERFDFRVKVSGQLGDKYDIQIFQDLPLYVKHEILKYGRIIYGGKSHYLYESICSVIKEFENFKRYLDMYYNKLESGTIAV